MGVKYLYEFLSSGVVSSTVENVDLIKLAKDLKKDIPLGQIRKISAPKLCLVVDGECCLNRLYGGYLSDWVCGGQWNRMVSFLTKFNAVLNNSNIELAIFFNGAMESQRMDEWIASQKLEHKKVLQVLNHVNRRGTPPPKGMWLPPAALRMAVRLMLRQQGMTVILTIDDHRQEVIAYCRENNFDGLIADDADYIAFDSPQLYSAHSLKMSFKGSLETKELKLNEGLKELGLTADKLCVLAALLGNYLLPESSLKDIYQKCGITATDTAEGHVRKLAKFVVELNLSSDIDDAATKIFGDEDDDRVLKFKQALQYYLDGTKDGYLRYRSFTSTKRAKNAIEKSKAEGADDILNEPDLDTSKLASETQGDDKSNILNTYKEASSCLTAGQDDKVAPPETGITAGTSESTAEDASSAIKKPKDKVPVLPIVPHEVMRTVSERHSKGLMSEYIYQILSQGEIKLPVVLEDGKEIPNIYAFYRPIRQKVYAIVFNLNHHRFLAMKNKTPLNYDIRIKEWVFNKNKGIHKMEYVKAEPLAWGVPTIQRLWFGVTHDDKRRRLRAFLTCMRSDVQLLLNPDYVPQQLLFAAVVLRYIMSFPDKRILRKQELDAFIVAALAPEFNNTEYTQELEIPELSSRGIQLAALFMKGVEMATLVNDACGAPIPWVMGCPWLYFDGKLFHYMFYRANNVKNLKELCDNRLGLMMRAEQMRQAILENLNVQFARPPMPAYGSPSVSEEMGRSPFSRGGRMRLGGIPSLTSRIAPNPYLRSRRQEAQLEVGGVVVGSWGANYSMQQSYDSLLLQGQAGPVGFDNLGYRAGRPSGLMNRLSKAKFSITQQSGGYGKKKFPKKFKKSPPPKGRGLTVGTSIVDDVPAENLEETNGSVADLNGEDLADKFEDAVVNGDLELKVEEITPPAVSPGPIAKPKSKRERKEAAAAAAATTTSTTSK